MRPLEFPLLADENIHPNVIDALRNDTHDIETVSDVGLSGCRDREIIEFAQQAGRVILTHDSDFGELAISQGTPFLGIVFLRPGHIQAPFVLGILSSIAARVPEVAPPFIVVAARRGEAIHIRVRQY